MAIHVYRTASSNGARQLSRAIPGGVRSFNIRSVRPGDIIVGWGESFQVPAGTRALNSAPINSKFTDALKLAEARVPTVEVSRTQPRLPDQPAVDTITPELKEAFEEVKELSEEFSEIRDLTLSQPFKDGVQDLIRQLTTFQGLLNRPAAPARPGGPDPNWIGRANNHVGGEDLLNPPAAPEYWVKKETLTEEYRVHSFRGKSIRAGKKVQRPGFNNPSSWIRSYEGGWFISYDNFQSTRQMRELAASAITALGLDFGAVDIGRTADGRLIVLEVNRAPGLEGGTVEAYVRAIQAWIEGREIRQDGQQRAA
jgi:hypothetical protein